MKGTICGRRAGFAALLSALSMAVAPAIAQADVSVGSATSAVPSASTAPAAPSVPALPAVPSAPAPATPAVPTPVGTLTAHVATPVASASVSTSVEKMKVLFQTGPAVAKTVGKAHQAVKATVKKTVSSSSITKNAVAEVKKIHSAAAKMAHPKIVVHQTTSSGRVLTWTSDDPHSGCNAGGWQICIPLTSFGPTQNQCNGEWVTLQGSGAMWFKFITNPSNGSMTTMQRTFFRGITATAPGTLGNNYFGTDQQNDRNKTFGLFGFNDDNREHEKLIVTQAAFPGSPTDVSMFLYIHTVLQADPFTGQITIKMAKQQIICKPGDVPDNDPDQGDHKSTDSHHNRGDYHGYNDDPNTWNEQE